MIFADMGVNPTPWGITACGSGGVVGGSGAVRRLSAAVWSRSAADPGVAEKNAERTSRDTPRRPHRNRTLAASMGPSAPARCTRAPVRAAIRRFALDSGDDQVRRLAPSLKGCPVAIRSVAGNLGTCDYASLAAYGTTGIASPVSDIDLAATG
jgi:hypothetical protein